MKRKILRGLFVEEFIHPHEKENKARALNNGILNNALNSAADFCHVAIEPVTQGTFVQMNEHCATKLLKVVRDVCTILEVDTEMLYYTVGNSITMIKGDHVRLTTLAAYMPGGGLVELPKMLFNKYLHSADSAP